MQALDFDFQRYIEQRKSTRKKQLREGAGYAFDADLRLMRRMSQAKPIELVFEETQRLFQSRLRGDLIKQATRVTPLYQPAIYQALQEAATRLHLSTPDCYFSDQLAVSDPWTLGTAEEAYVVIPAGLIDRPAGPHWLHWLGAACGHIQNGHVPLQTALFYLSHGTQGLTRWATAPAKALLRVWQKRAAITADRAGVLCTQNADDSLSAIRQMATFIPSEELALRLRSLACFCTSQYFLSLMKQPGGISNEVCDETVARLFDEKQTPEEDK